MLHSTVLLPLYLLWTEKSCLQQQQQQRMLTMAAFAAGGLGANRSCLLVNPESLYGSPWTYALLWMTYVQGDKKGWGTSQREG